MKNQLGIGVASGITAGLVLIIVEPLLRSTWRGLGQRMPEVLDWLSGSVIRQASLGTNNYLDVMLLWFAHAAILGTVSAAVFGREKPKPLPIALQKLLKVLRRPLAVTVILMILANSAFVFFVLQMTSTFEQRLYALAPVLSHEEEELQWARWATMTKRADYSALMAEMETLAQERGVALPRPLLR